MNLNSSSPELSRRNVPKTTACFTLGSVVVGSHSLAATLTHTGANFVTNGSPNTVEQVTAAKQSLN